MSAIVRRRGPIHLDILHKDMWIEPRELQMLVGCPPHRPSFWAAVLQLVEAVKRRHGIIARTEGVGVDLRMRLMTDAEASAYLTRKALGHASKLSQCADDLRTRVDARNLSDAESRAHEHASRVIGAIADAAKAEARKHRRLLEFISAPAAE